MSEGKKEEKEMGKTARETMIQGLLFEEGSGVGDIAVMDKGEGLPEGQTMVEHMERYHPDGFDPETDECKYVEKVKEELECDVLGIEDCGRVRGQEEDKSNKGGEEGSESDVEGSRSARKGKGKGSVGVVSPEEDAAYMEAVEKGDMETAKKMVRETFKKSFPNNKIVHSDGSPVLLFHGTSEKGFNTFDTEIGGETSGVLGTGGWFTTSPEIAQHYAAMDNREGEVKKVFVNLTSPYFFDAEGATYAHLYFPDIEKKDNDKYIVTATIGKRKRDDEDIPHELHVVREFTNREEAEAYKKALEGRPQKRIVGGNIKDIIGEEEYKRRVKEYIEERGERIHLLSGEKEDLFKGNEDGRIGDWILNIFAQWLQETPQGQRVMDKSPEYKRPFELTTEEIIGEKTVSSDDIALYIRDKGENDGVVLSNIIDVPAEMADEVEDEIEAKKAVSMYVDEENERNQGLIGTDVVVFEAKNIHSADPVTYYDDGSVVPLSKRFGGGNDIRFAEEKRTDKPVKDELVDALTGEIAAEDEMPKEGMVEHDRRHHPNGYKEGDECKYRDQIKVELGADVLEIGDIGKKWKQEGDREKKQSQGVPNIEKKEDKWDEKTRREAEAAAKVLERMLKGVKVEFADKPYEGNGDAEDERQSILSEYGALRLGIGRLGDAKMMEEKGARRKEIFEKTGWWKAKDGKWRFEIDNVHLSPKVLDDIKKNLDEKGVLEYKVQDLIPGDRVLQAYMFIGSRPVIIKRDAAEGDSRVGDYDRWKKTISIYKVDVAKEGWKYDLEETFLHELQHAIQDIEGTSYEIGDSNDAKDIRDSTYWRSLHEVEARNVAERIHCPKWEEDEDYTEKPWATEDVPKYKQIVRYFKDENGKVVGEYNRKSGKITLYPGAKVSDVVHEFSHGLWQFAEQEAKAGRKGLLKKMSEIAESAPQAVKDAVKSDYPEVSDNVYLEECFTHELARRSDTAFAKAIETSEGKPWYKRAWGTIKDIWRGAAAKVGLNKADIDKIGDMSPDEAAQHILSEMAKGRTFGTLEKGTKGKDGDGNSRKSIIGESGAERLGIGKLDEAKEMEAAGKDRKQIWKETGWWKGKDGKWRVELDETSSAGMPKLQSAINPRTKKVLPSAPLGEFIVNNRLFEAYPELAKLPVFIDRELKVNGVTAIWRRKGTTDWKPAFIALKDKGHQDGQGRYHLSPKELKSLTHEIQHAIQGSERFAFGAMPGEEDNYNEAAGEVEARNAANREEMTSEERQSTSPWETEDVPEEKQYAVPLTQQKTAAEKAVGDEMVKVALLEGLLTDDTPVFDGGEEDPSLPANGSMVKHMERYHPDGFDPKTDECKYLDKIEAQLEPDILHIDDVGKKWKDSGNEGKKKIEGLSNKAEKKFREQISKKHPELDVDLVLTEIGKIKDPKLQQDAFAWVMKGAVRLPEDMYKVERARHIATKAKKDPLSYESPQACVNDLLKNTIMKEGKPITTAELRESPYIYNYQDLGNGVEVMNVDESEEGQRLMRSVLNTHYGTDFSPWCLLHDDGRGGLSSQARTYWEHYNALPKKIAFYKGKPVAFMATSKGPGWEERAEKLYPEYVKECRKQGKPVQNMKEYKQSYLQVTGADVDSPQEEWWDLNDQSYAHIPLMETVKDKKGQDIGGRTSEYIDGEMILKREKLKDGTERRWNDNGQIMYEELPDGTERRWDTKGHKLREILPDETIKDWDELGNRLPEGTVRTWNKDQMKSEKWPDGTQRVWNDEGQIRLEELPDGTGRRWYDNGQKESERLPDGTVRKWEKNGQIMSEGLSDGTRRTWYDNGQKRMETLPDGTERHWYENGQMKGESLPDRTTRSWYENGQMSYASLLDGTILGWFKNGQKEQERLPDGTEYWWYENGQKRSEYLPPGIMYRWYETGEKESEGLPDGTFHRWYKNGQMEREILPDGTDNRWLEDGQKTSGYTY